MTTVSIPVGVSVLPEPAQMARNGLHANAFNTARMIGIANHLARYRPKCVATFTTPLANSGLAMPFWQLGAPSTRERWRSAYHSSPFCGQLRFALMQFRQQRDIPGGIHPVAGEIEITVATMAGTTVAKAVIPGAAGSDSLDDNSVEMRNMFVGKGVFVDPTTGAPVDLAPDTGYQITVVEKENATVIALSIFEDTLGPSTENGYVDPSIAVMTPIYSAQREGVADILRAKWLRGGAHLFNWSRLLNSSTGNVESPSTTSASLVNLIDGSGGGVTAATPGIFMDLTTGLTRLNNPNVVKAAMSVYAKCTSNGNGNVNFQQQSGGNIDAGPFTTSFTWVTGTGGLDPTPSKIDMQFQTAAGTLTVGAVSVYLLES